LDRGLQAKEKPAKYRNEFLEKSCKGILLKVRNEVTRKKMVVKKTVLLRKENN
jgi:hypothetical protein